ncbi:MAG: hypothetical protein PHC80_00675 [Eubacteriales bacterium]|nr:hypothetical protein [Eubacteriales bacterium]
MACFIVPAAEAIITKTVTKAVSKKEQVSVSQSLKIPFSQKLGWLTKLLAGGSVLLAFEHVWHGEVTPWFPFLTAAANPADTAEMLHEMATAGVAMAALVTLVWAGMLAVCAAVEKKAQRARANAE